MASGSRVCPHCGKLNSVDDKACYSCGKRMSGPMMGSARGFLSDFSADGLPATKLIAGVCILIFGLMMASDALMGSGVSLMGFRSSTLVRFGMLLGFVIRSEPWRLLSAVFLHASLLHIGMNMLSLVNLGRALEPHFRSARFLLLYLTTGVLGFCATIWWRGDQARSVGASGAIFGLLGAYIGALIVRRHPGWQRVFVNNLVMALILGFMFGGQVDNAAHVGGFVAGLLLGLLLELERKPRSRDRVLTGLAAAGGLAVVASIALSNLSPVWRLFREAEQQPRGEDAERRGQDSE